MWIMVYLPFMIGSWGFGGGGGGGTYIYIYDMMKHFVFCCLLSILVFTNLNLNY